MKQRTSVFVCTLLLAVAGAQAQSADSKSGPFAWWGRYTVKGDEFSVRLPTLPAMKTAKVFNKRLAKERVEHRLRTSLDGVIYIIDVFENAEPRLSLDEFIAEENPASGFDPATERNLLVNDVVGKGYSSGKTSPAVVQFFVTKRRLYRFAANGAGLEHAAVQEFFSSIRLNKKEKAVAVLDGPGTPLEVEGERIYKGKEVDKKLRLLTKPEPQYTDEAREKNVSGTVILRAVFSGTGEVRNIQVIKGLPYGLTEVAIRAAKVITFTPAMKDGKPVSMWIQLEYNFNR